MNRALLVLAFLIGLAFPIKAQTAMDPNEGSRISFDSTTGICTFSWWGRSGMSYFVQYSEDLMNWSYLPLIVQGTDSVASLGFQTNAVRLFMRLIIDSDPFNTDSDGDGMPDGWEVLNGLNPHFNDAAADPDGDGYTNLEEYALGLDPHLDQYGTGQRTQFYTFDPASRLTGVSSNLGETFTYDPEGNLTNSQ